MTLPRDAQAPIAEDKNETLEIMRHVFGDNLNVNGLELIRNISLAHHYLKVALNKTMSSHLSPARLAVLIRLYSEAEQHHTGLLPSELSRIQGIAPNSMTSLLQGLRDQGLIAQVSHPGDRRKQIIQITDAGRALIDNEKQNYKQLFNLVQNLTPEEQQIVAMLLHKLIQP